MTTTSHRRGIMSHSQWARELGIEPTVCLNRERGLLNFFLWGSGQKMTGNQAGALLVALELQKLSEAANLAQSGFRRMPGDQSSHRPRNINSNSESSCHIADLLLNCWGFCLLRDMGDKVYVLTPLRVLSLWQDIASLVPGRETDHISFLKGCWVQMEWWEPAFKLFHFFKAIPICKTQVIQSLASNMVVRINGVNICNALSEMTEKIPRVDSTIYSHSTFRLFSKHYVPRIILDTLKNILLHHHKLQRSNSYYPHFTAKESQKVKYFLGVTLAFNWWLLFLPYGEQFSNNA